MQLQVSCVSLLLLLAALGPVVAVATARRETLITAATGGDEVQGHRAGAGAGDASRSLQAVVAAKGGAEEVIIIRRRKVDEAVTRRFRTGRKTPAAASQVGFDGRIPFTADYTSVHRHPPAHN